MSSVRPFPFPDESISAILSALEEVRPCFIYLFGSFATGQTHPESDIDIAFLAPTTLPALFCFECASQLSEQLGHEVDLIDLSRASTVLAKEVFRTGRLIHVTDDLRRQTFEMRVLSDYARLNEERREILAHGS